MVWDDHFSAAADGTLVYLPRSSALTSELAWLDFDGKKLDTLWTAGNHTAIELSPSGKLTSVTAVDPITTTQDIWICDTARKSSTRLTTHPRNDVVGIWSPDEKQVVFSSDRNGAFDLYLKDVESIEPEKLLFASSDPKYPLSWSPDGKYLLFLSLSLKTKWDLWLLSLDAEPPNAEPFLNSEYDEVPAKFSPDGKWVAYGSSEQGTREVFAITFPDRRNKIKISGSGGSRPRWAPDGARIFYQDLEDYVVEVPVPVVSDRLVPGQPKRLFQLRTTTLYSTYDVAPDAPRLLTISRQPATNRAPLKVVMNWPLEFQKK